MDHFCCYYSQFIDLLELESIFNNNVVLMTIFETYIFYYHDFDVYSCYSGFFNFCHNCWTCISGGRKLKFGIFNKMPKLYCQYYSASLKDLISAEEGVIAKVYLVITIMKLRLNNSFKPGIYKSVYGYFMLLPPNLGPLLILLPSETTSVDNIIQVVWASKILLLPEQLSEFVSI